MKPGGRVQHYALIGVMLLSAVALQARAGVDNTYRTEVELSSRDISAKESALGDLVADAIRASAHTDVALIIAASFNDAANSIKPGAFEIADALKMLDYRNETIAILKLNGAQIQGALEHGLSLYPKPNSSFLQTSGLTCTVDPSSGEVGRVTAIKIDGEPMTAAKSYHIAMPMTLADGALAYFKFWKKSDIDKDTGKTLEAALTSYLNNHKTLTKGEDRITIRGAQRETGHG